MTSLGRKMPARSLSSYSQKIVSPSALRNEGDFRCSVSKVVRNQAQEIYLIKEMFLETKTKTTSALQKKEYQKILYNVQQPWNC